MSKVLIVLSSFHEDISQFLFDVAKNKLSEMGFEQDLIKVPGAFEIPAAILFAALSSKTSYDGYIALGCVIKGKTDHYDHVARSLSQAIMDISVQHMLPIGFGVITAQNTQQAIERSSGNSENNIALQAVKSVTTMIDIRNSFM